MSLSPNTSAPAHQVPARPASARSASARPASVVNEEIRELWQRSGGLLSPEDETEYQRLLVEWAAVTGTSVRPAV
ncbi:hypothetical protein [Streptomyces nitrosporeus]|uniref:Uncharacterized protein n=1 Tax=Streptomyces nitrosporeus TaxID=28894 RepID=A0A5J6FJ89_9ACTN|nr:hypothetical protein [Streptomyces nitrosporeus]QEU75887.1 hypothetical protein CP967_31465 [Streptomyces nitrosporeus]GGY89147.1 hypothetical protein GCM10010327_19910 [Streptomyces nitrosporeus]